MKVFIIAEVGNLHNGSLDLSKELARSAAECGADAVKFQTHIFSAESLADAPNPAYFQAESRKAYFERTAFTVAQWQELKKFVEAECRLEFMSSPFSEAAVDLLEQVGMRRYKIPSGEVTNILLLQKIARTKKAVLLSSGMSSWEELDAAVNVFRKAACDLTVMQCSSIYPCPPEKVGLNNLVEMKQRYNLPVGLSDHTFGFAASIAAVVLGASVIEKHLMLSSGMYGSDVKHSLVPAEFRRFVKEIREAEAVLSAETSKDALAQELHSMKVIFQKSIVAARVIPKGTVIQRDMLDFKKPGDGIGAERFFEVVGKRAKTDIPMNTKIKEEMLEA